MSVVGRKSTRTAAISSRTNRSSQIAVAARSRRVTKPPSERKAKPVDKAKMDKTASTKKIPPKRTVAAAVTNKSTVTTSKRGGSARSTMEKKPAPAIGVRRKGTAPMAKEAKKAKEGLRTIGLRRSGSGGFGTQSLEKTKPRGTSTPGELVDSIPPTNIEVRIRPSPRFEYEEST